MAVLNLRGVPDELKARLKKAAVDNGRTLFEECVARLDAESRIRIEMDPNFLGLPQPVLDCDPKLADNLAAGRHKRHHGRESRVAAATEAVAAIGERVVAAAELPGLKVPERKCSKCGNQMQYRGWMQTPDFWCFGCRHGEGV